MTNDNYPMGAANDPDAPYNAPLGRDTLAKVSERLERQCYLYVHNDEEDPFDVYDKTELWPLDIIRECQKLCKALLKDGKPVYHGICVADLAASCEGWDSVETDVCWACDEKKPSDDLMEFL